MDHITSLVSLPLLLACTIHQIASSIFTAISFYLYVKQIISPILSLLLAACTVDQITIYFTATFSICTKHCIPSPVVLTFFFSAFRLNMTTFFIICLFASLQTCISMLLYILILCFPFLLVFLPAFFSV